VILSFFFHGRGSPLQRTTLGLFRSLIHQLCRQIPQVLFEMTSLYQSKVDSIGKFGQDWQWHEAELRALLEQFLQKASENSWSIRIYVDALDEAGEDIAVELVSFFQRMIFNFPSEGSRIKICFSCRHYPIITLENGLTVLVEDENGRDIESYVQEELEIAQLSAEKLFELKSKIVQRASGVFQWVVLVTQMAIKDCRQGRNVKKALDSIRCMPKELHKLYELILHQISKESVAESLHMLQWMCFAERPLTITELRFAWVVDEKSPYSCIRDCTSSTEYAEDDDEMEKRLKTLSGGLAEIKRHGKFRIAQLIHQSVNDYLVPGGLERLSHNCSHDPGSSMIGAAQFRLSRSCINYLKMTEIQSWKETKGVEINGYEMESLELQSCFPFLRYSAAYWLFHAQKAEKEGVGQQDLLELLQWQSSNFVQKWCHLNELAARVPSDDPKCYTEWYTSLFHVAAKYNLKSALAAMLSGPEETKIDTPDNHLWTALCYASETGDLEIVKLLVDHGANVNWATQYDGSPLMIAARYSHTPIMKLLLENGASLCHVSSPKDTILGTAVARATIEAINLLLEAGADLEFKTGFAQISPLSVAAERGRKDVVNLLLSKGAELESADFRNLTSLCWAAEGGHEDILEIFLQKGANPDVQTKGCFSPLLIAAVNGHCGVVKRLIEIGMDINHVTELGHTALHVAAAEGRSDVIELLLQHGADVSKVNLVDELGERVELDTTYMDHEQILHLLIEHGKHLSLPDV
jgi:ankyrin repeat protein